MTAGRLLPGVIERFARFKEEGRTIILLTNAPRPASTVQAHLDQLGLPRDLYDAVSSSGEAGIAGAAPARGARSGSWGPRKTGTT